MTYEPGAKNTAQQSQAQVQLKQKKEETCE